MGEISYISKKIIGRAHCAACDITHSISELGEKKEFKQCRLQFEEEILTLHCDEILPAMVEIVQRNKLPIVLHTDVKVGYKVLLNSHELEEIRGSVSVFENTLKAKLAQIEQ